MCGALKHGCDGTGVGSRGAGTGWGGTEVEWGGMAPGCGVGWHLGEVLADTVMRWDGVALGQDEVAPR